MKGKAGFAAEMIIVALVLAVCVAGINEVLLPEHNVETFAGFYELQEESVDVLFLGSSHSMTSFIPQELYDEYGITSYNLGSGNQSVLISYYWLKEALQTQSPKVVVLEAFMLYQRQDLLDQPLNSTEGDVRNAMNYMRMGVVKREAIEAICEEDGSQTELSYYLPWIRYHARWTELTADDFIIPEDLAVTGLMGYSILYGSEPSDYQPIETGISDEIEELDPVMVKYLDKMVDLCEEEGIDLILAIVPTDSSTVERYNATVELAEQFNIPIYDFNESSLY